MKGKKKIKAYKIEFKKKKYLWGNKLTIRQCRVQYNNVHKY